MEDINWSDVENLWGLYEAVPGLRYLLELTAGPEIVRGFINGSQLIQDEYMQRCDELVAEELVNETIRLWNISLTVFEQEDGFEAVFYVFDAALLFTKILSQLHPVTFNCFNAGETTYEHYYDIIVNENGYNPKNYIMNLIYNFGHIFDAYRDAWLFVV